MTLAAWPSGINAIPLSQINLEPFREPLQTEMEDNNIRRRGRPGDRVRTIQQAIVITQAQWESHIDAFLFDNRAKRIVMPAWNGKEVVPSVVMIIGPKVSNLGVDHLRIDMTLKVIREIVPIVLSGIPVTVATEDVPYTRWRAFAQGGVPNYTFSVGFGTLPAGLSINAETGELSGTPTESGLFEDIVVTATDQQGGTGTLAPFSINVAAAD